MSIKKKIYDIKPPRNWKNTSSRRSEEDLVEVHKIQNTVEEIPPINYLEEDEDTSWLKNIKEKNTLRKVVTPKIHFKHFHLVDQSLFKKIIIPLCGVIFLVGL